MATMTTQPLYTPTADRTAYDIQPAGVLLLLADAVYGEDRNDATATGQACAENMILAILAAARAGGYTQTDILQTIIVRGERSKRIQGMARAACTAAGNERLSAIFDSMRKGKL